MIRNKINKIDNVSSKIVTLFYLISKLGTILVSDQTKSLTVPKCQ